MSNYVVTYDLYNPGQNYAAVEKAVQACGKAGKILQTVWYLSSSMTGEQIRSKVWAAMDANDRLLVVEAKMAWGQNIGENWNVIERHWSTKAVA